MANEYYISAGLVPNDSAGSSNSYYISAGLIPAQATVTTQIAIGSGTGTLAGNGLALQFITRLAIGSGIGTFTGNGLTINITGTLGIPIGIGSSSSVGLGVSSKILIATTFGSASFSGNFLTLGTRRFVSISSGTASFNGQVIANIRTFIGPVEFPIEEPYDPPVIGSVDKLNGYWSVGISEVPIWNFTAQADLPIPYHKHPVLPEVCGHWHKGPIQTIVSFGTYEWWQPSVDINNTYAALVGMSNDGLYGVIAALYNFASSSWDILSIATFQIGYAVPNTCRLSGSDYIAYYVHGFPTTNDFVHPAYRFIRFNFDGTYSFTDVWSGDSADGDPYQIYEQAAYNKMDCIGTRVACVTWVQKKAGLVYDRWAVKVSNNNGATFSDDIPFSATYAVGVEWNYELRMTVDGIAWICGIYNTSTTQELQLWKSNAACTSFTQVFGIDYLASTGTRNVLGFAWDITKTTGNEIAIQLPRLAGGVVLYVSADGGNSFTPKVFNPAGATLQNKLSSDGLVINIPGRNAASVRGFYHSIDAGTSFSFITPPTTIGHTFIDYQEVQNAIIYTECGQDYTGDSRQDVLISKDSGASYTVLESPASITGDPTTELVGGVHNPVWEFTKQPNVL